MRRITSASLLLVALLMGGAALADPAPESRTPQACLDADPDAAPCALHAEDEATTPQPHEVAAATPTLPIFTPPPRGDSKVRIGGVDRPGRRL